LSLGASLLEALQSIPENLKNLGGTILDPFGVQVGDVSDAEESAEELDVDAGIFVTMRNFFHNSTASAIAYLLFVLLYVPCVVAVSTAWKEVGMALTVLQMIYSTVLGWSLATVTFQLLEGHSWAWILFSVLLLIGTVSGIILYARRTGKFDGKTDSRPLVKRAPSY
ncbi:MAG TPA: hypothetical protein VLM37_03815, partial [Fibrobacteraceae bacterium]|nr:hypothetical protein [Fibrobacteraceae bacterium]